MLTTTTALKNKLNELIRTDKKMEIFGSNEPWNGHHYALNPVLTEEQAMLLENKFAITLPAEYKAYITGIANGGAGPYYGLYTAETAIQNSIERFTEAGSPHDGAFTKSFNYTNEDVLKWKQYYDEKIANGDDDDIVNFNAPDKIYGVIFLSEYGCGGYYVFVVTGDQAGTVWFLQEGEYLFPYYTKNKQWGFNDWFGNWLDESLQQLNKNASGTVEPENDYSATILNYDGQQLTAIPGEVFLYKNLKKLVFSRNQLSVFPQQLSELQELRTLDLNMNPLIDIDPSVGKLTNLRKLDLSYNHHTDLPDELAKLEKLEELRLVYTPKLVQFPLVISKLKNLKKLNLYSSAIENIPDKIAELKHLQSLELDSNPIKELPESIGELSHLTYLGLKNTKLSRLPEGIRKLTKLESLNIDISNFDLADATEKIKDLSALKYLTIALRQTYPENFAGLKNIVYLTVEFNYGEEPEPSAIPDNLCLIPNIEELKLDLNGSYEKFPAGIGNLKKLKVLDISNTKISELPESVRELKMLEKIIPSNEMTEEYKNRVNGWFPHIKWW